MAKRRQKEPLKVTVCTWDPQHTLDLVRAQQDALEDGTLAKLVKKHGKGTSALRAAMVKERLVTMKASLNGDLHCPSCGALMETVIAKDGITDRTLAYEDVVMDFSAAIERTRRSR